MAVKCPWKDNNYKRLNEARMLYWVKGWTLRRLAKKYRISFQAVHQAFKAHRVATRPAGYGRG